MRCCFGYVSLGIRNSPLNSQLYYSVLFCKVNLHFILSRTGRQCYIHAEPYIENLVVEYVTGATTWC